MVIVDLFSQREAVAAKLRELPVPDKISWLQQRGELIEIPMSAPDASTYLFRSSAGIETVFFIRNGQMVFLGDHTTIDSVTIH